MTPADVPPPTRRSRRIAMSTDAAGTADTAATVVVETPAPTSPAITKAPPATKAAPITQAPPVIAAAPIVPAPRAESAPIAFATAPGVGAATTVGAATAVDERPAAAPQRVAFAWLDERALLTGPSSTAALEAAASPLAPASADLLATAPRRSPFRAGVIVPVLLIALLFGGYAATTLLWPLHAVAPEVTAVQVEPAAAAVAAPPWPGEGSAGIAVSGIPGTLTTSADPTQIASITKVVTALLVLEEMPLAVGEAGPDYRFTANDRSLYQGYRNRGESALAVPVGGSLTQYQMLQGMLIGSANNYADRLASNLWPNDAVFARAATDWLASHGVSGMTIVEPTGFDSRNVATNDALLSLAAKALANPVIAEIVRTASVDLPGAGVVTNTNDLLADPGVIGIKTGMLDSYNLLSAKDITVGETTIRLTASVLGQSSAEARSAASRALYAQLEAELQPTTAVDAGTTAGVVETKWGSRVTIVTTEPSPVILWNGGAPTVASEFSLGDSRDAGDEVGSLTTTGPFGATTVSLKLDGDIEPPSAWWRLTHPLDLFGLAG